MLATGHDNEGESSVLSKSRRALPPENDMCDPTLRLSVDSPSTDNDH